MDVTKYNREAWDKAVERDDPWTVPVPAEATERARRGDFQIVLTPTRPMPRTWLPASLAGVEILALAAGGGQQGPLLAAAGARVTVLDLSPRQLAQDRFVAGRDGLALATVEGDMAALPFADASFDVVLNPCSTCFVPDVRAVWREAARVLRRGGHLATGFINPTCYLFDKALERDGKFEVRYALPYADVTSLSDAERARYTSYQAPLEYSHTLSDHIGGQLEAGLALVAMYEDDWGGREPVDRYFKSFLATLARRD